MTSFNRRQFLQSSLAALSASSVQSLFPYALLAQEKKPRPKLPVAAIVTEYRENSHADVIVGKILEGWRQDRGSGPDLTLAALYTDQVPAQDMSRDLSRKYGFPITDTIEEAITLGTGEVAVAGVLSIGEHGNYPYTPDTHQHRYPRRRFFDEIAATFRKFDKVVPVFNDKHLAYAWKDAKHMYDTAREMHIPFMAGSSIPVAWRKPSVMFPRGEKLTEAVIHGYGGPESYGFHTLEGLQCMVERRQGGETGVTQVQAVRGEAVAQSERDGRWSRKLLEAAGATFASVRSHQSREIAKNTLFYLIEYRDGLQAAAAMNTGWGNEFAFAGNIRDKAKPFAAWIRLQEPKPYEHFAHLLHGIEHMIHTGEPAYPAERTLLTTGILDAAMHSIADGDKLIPTPHLNVAYQPTEWTFAQGELGDPPRK